MHKTAGKIPVEHLEEMVVRLSELEAGAVDRVFRFDRAWVNAHLGHTALDEEGSGGELSVDIALSGRTVTVSGRLQGRIYVPCSRCLEPALVTLDSPFFLVLEPRPEGDRGPEELELGPEDLDLGYYMGREFDLAPYVAEQLVLAVPMKPLCRPDCWPEWFEGLVHTEGEQEWDGAEDPRWAPLKALMDKGPKMR